MNKMHVSKLTARLWAAAALLLGLALQGSALARGNVSAEAWVSEARPFVHQSIIYTLRVYHGAVKELTPEPLNVPGVSMERLDGPPETTRTIDSQRLYSDFHYALTALNVGPLRIPPIRIKVTPGRSTDRYGRITGGRGSEFMVDGTSVTLDVQAAPATAARPWLPVYELKLSAEVNGQTNARVGEPLTLTITQQTWGGSGDQIPKFGPHLRNPDLKIYIEQSEVLTEIHDSGRYLIGIRQETFTLIPTRDGELHIPPVEVQWWDINANRQTSSRWAGLTIPVGVGTGGEAGEAGSAAGPQGLPMVVMVLLFMLVAAASFFLGWWLSSGRPGIAALLSRTAAPLEEGAEQETRPPGRLAQWHSSLPERRRALMDRLLLVKPRQRWGARLRGLEPRWMTLWRLRADMGRTKNPKQLEALVQRYAAIQLGLKEYASLTEIGAAIRHHYPKLTGTSAQQLLQRLDAGLYGGETDDPGLKRCNKDLCCVLRAMGLRCPPDAKAKPRSTLPALNPGHHNT